MRLINLETWPRREHYEVFSTWEYPHFSMCANVDLGVFSRVPEATWDLVQRGDSVHNLTRRERNSQTFRRRIREGKAVEHETIHPSTTILTKDDLFSFCTIEYSEDFSLFAGRAADQIACIQEQPTLKDPDRDDLIYMTAIPWVSFTSFMHPLKLNPGSIECRALHGGNFSCKANP